MLSRVAAVMAPRTHNRLRVTGSSGRRREGRESEPQRPNMSWHLFHSAVLLLLVVMMCCCNTGGAAGEALPVRESSNGKLFVWKDVEGGKVTSLRVPSLVEMKGDVFAVAEAQCKKDGEANTFTGIASKLLKLEDKTTTEPVEVLNDANTKTQILEEGASQEKKVDVSRPTVVMEGSNIYMLVGKYSHEPADICQGETDAAQFGLLLVKGEVSGEKEGKKIHWNDTHAIPCSLFKQDHGSWTQLVGGGGSGIKLKDDTLVFPVEGKKKENDDATEEDKKTVSLIISSLEDTKSWKLSKGVSDGGCSDPSVVEWKEDKLIMMTACDGGRRRVYESGDKGESWTEALGTLSRVWGRKQKGPDKGVGSGFTTATIDGVEDANKRDVMLITLPVYANTEGNGKGRLHLWLTDNTHIVYIGPVSGEEDEEIASSSLLYTSGGVGSNNEDKLIALYEKKKEGTEEATSYGIFSVRLTAQLDRVKEVLRTWKEVDERIFQLCASGSDAGDRPTNTPCSATDNITAGLVGFLSGNFSNDTWRDEYLGVNATVHNKERSQKADNGVKFTGRGAGAEWPVGKQGENQLYHFANYNFTLVATVSIDGEPKEGSLPLMGVRAGSEGGTKLMELSYKKGNKWTLQCGIKPTTEHSRDWKPGTTYQVAIVLQNGTQGTVYIDGESVLGEAPCELENTEPKEISHFYIGGDEGSAGSEEEVSVTVSNVLLYNRPLASGEITALKTKLSIPKAEEPKTRAGDLSTPSAVHQPGQERVLRSTLGGDQPTVQEPLKGGEGPDTGGASKSANTTVTTHSAGSHSEERLALGGSSDGSQTMDAGSPSDGNPAVETGRRAGGPVQDGTAVNPDVGVSTGENGEMAGGTGGREEKQIREVNSTALSSNLGNVSQANNSDAGTMRGSGLLPSLLLLLLGLWGFAAL
ncbi:trans-sialidase, putative [Trypanosoma cruzi marinkellei]|uniref:Trans-sialidase, putative n=1 Tax=Trypanosoma cruzi marinkellei TaxID=85056 RepID=K2M3T0_TRYCR|nr:trans-sialidase, putative [Trypanosoma cruzi marinkellei]